MRIATAFPPPPPHDGRPYVLVATFALLLGGCASVAVVTGQTEATAAALQSETAATTSVASGQQRIVVAFNDMTGNEGTIILGDNSRVVHRGASLMRCQYRVGPRQLIGSR